MLSIHDGSNQVSKNGKDEVHAYFKVSLMKKNSVFQTLIFLLTHFLFIVSIGKSIIVTKNTIDCMSDDQHGIASFELTINGIRYKTIMIYFKIKATGTVDMYPEISLIFLRKDLSIVNQIKSK